MIEHGTSPVSSLPVRAPASLSVRARCCAFNPQPDPPGRHGRHRAGQTARLNIVNSATACRFRRPAGHRSVLRRSGKSVIDRRVRVEAKCVVPRSVPSSAGKRRRRRPGPLRAEIRAAIDTLTVSCRRRAGDARNFDNASGRTSLLYPPPCRTAQCGGGRTPSCRAVRSVVPADFVQPQHQRKTHDLEHSHTTPAARADNGVGDRVACPAASCSRPSARKASTFRRLTISNRPG